MQAEIKILTVPSGKYISMIVNHGKWEFREDVPVPDDYEINENSEQYKLCKGRLIENIRTKFPDYAD